MARARRGTTSWQTVAAAVALVAGLVWPPMPSAHAHEACAGSPAPLQGLALVAVRPGEIWISAATSEDWVEADRCALIEADEDEPRDASLSHASAAPPAADWLSLCLFRASSGELPDRVVAVPLRC